MKYLQFGIVFCCILFFCTVQNNPATIILYPQNASLQEKLAAKELRRYIYLRSGMLFDIKSSDQLDVKDQDVLIVAEKDQPILSRFTDPDLEQLGEQQYLLKTYTNDERNVLLISGGDQFGVLYGTYRFLEHLGMRFYLHNDVVPDQRYSWFLPTLDEKGQPLFDLRGIHPFHDFAEGPDWWNLDDYKAILAQLPKMGMNFFALHCYPERRWDPEPTVWIGKTEDIQPDGQVNFAYTASYQNTLRGDWGYASTPTSEFDFGAYDLFEKDGYGPDVLQEWIPRPKTTAANVSVFNNTGEMFKDAFSFARELGIKTCMGTESPLTIPDHVKTRLSQLGLDAESDTTVLKMYEGMFERIKRMHPLDYYWIWTPESWTWQDISEKEIQKTEKDLVIATKAARNIDAPFTLATCGWVLGPPEDADRFDQILPKEMPFSCINRYLGFEFVDPTFEKLQNRPKWAIPWLEDDPAMVSPQLWAGRMRTDAVDALEYGCTGLMGIHWRTRAIGPTVSSLAKAAWRQNKWKTELPDTVRDMPVRDFYVDWAGANFGQNVAESLGDFFTQLDGGPYCPFRSGMVANLYRTSKWNQGPGAILVNSKPWNEIKTEFTFVDELKKYQTEIQGKGNQKRFDYWLKTFQYTKTMAELGCILGAIDSTIQRVNTMPNIVEKKSMVKNKALGLRIKATQKWQDMVTLLLATVSTPGEMGTVANLEQHSKNHLQLLTRHDSLMTAILGRPLPDSVKPDKKYHGSFRIIVPTKRTLLQENEHLILKVIVLSREPVKTVKMNWRPLGSRSFQTKRAKHLARGVYTIKLNSETIGNQDFEYYIDVKTNETDGLFPVTAPDINQTVVVM